MGATEHGVAVPADRDAQPVQRCGAWLLLDSRVVDVPMASNPIVVTLSSLKPFFFNGLQSGGALLGPWWSIRPRNPIRATLVYQYEPGASVPIGSS